MEKKIVAIMGSPHVNGNVAHSLEYIRQGAERAGHAMAIHQLARLNIQNCTGCRRCIGNGGCCVLKDDMGHVFEDIKGADILVVGAPIYICQVNGYTKTFLDRLYPLTDEKHHPRFGTRDLVMLYTYGAPVPLVFQKYIRYTGKSLRAMGLMIKKNIVLHGCTTLDKVKTDNQIQSRLTRCGAGL